MNDQLLDKNYDHNVKSMRQGLIILLTATTLIFAAVWFFNSSEKLNRRNSEESTAEAMTKQEFCDLNCAAVGDYNQQACIAGCLDNPEIYSQE